MMHEAGGMTQNQEFEQAGVIAREKVEDQEAPII
jgi:hypothetical protein